MVFRNRILDERDLGSGSGDGVDDLEETFLRCLAEAGAAVSRSELRRLFDDLRAAFVADLMDGRVASLLGILEMRRVGGEFQVRRPPGPWKPAEWSGHGRLTTDDG